ncbi:MAG TPA: hypothetical protein VMT30_01945 [Candidatus Saccharimonadia bacterium]|nr:hypothetical protein [Candidatus Saccharimonadia bacterium]
MAQHRAQAPDDFSEFERRIVDPLDGCDRCGARGQVRVTVPECGSLVFCGHHRRDYELLIRDRKYPVEPLVGAAAS